MWLKWLPWRMIIRNVAKQKGFLDPVTLWSRLERFSQPSEVAAPVELLRSGAVMHARGLLNSQAIQHNMDWIWPYWVECQFNPRHIAFVPRAFSLTHINLTQRNWTAVGLPGMGEYPIVDPRGLLTPFFDGWSLDAWIVAGPEVSLVPSRVSQVRQCLEIDDNLRVVTRTEAHGLCLSSMVVFHTDPEPQCCLRLEAEAVDDTLKKNAWLVVSARPYNPEGVSFIHDIQETANGQGWRVNRRHGVYFSERPSKHVFSSYGRGDVFARLWSQETEDRVSCAVGMATAAACFPLPALGIKTVEVSIPWQPTKSSVCRQGRPIAVRSWTGVMEGLCELRVPDAHMKFLYDAALRSLVLHAPAEVYPGPYTYRRFWFRDAALIMNAMLSVGLHQRVKQCVDLFPRRQTPLGYFLSQEGEWDSNGEALWIMRRYCELTNVPPPRLWRRAARQAGEWIIRKRLSERLPKRHAGLFPAGFSAEHLGPNDYYYWDDFWGVAGLRAAAFLEGRAEETAFARRFAVEADRFLRSIDKSLAQVQTILGRPGMPASPYRRLDAGAIGSLAVGYPLQLWPGTEARLLDTVEFLLATCMVDGGFFQDMTHSGINPYLTLHMAQVLLRAKDTRYWSLVETVARLASPTGQWPEAIHPRTGGGCMGDGQHVWAAAEWVLMMKNCFVLEEEDKLILGAGIPPAWRQAGQPLSMGPVWTKFGQITVHFVFFSNQPPEVTWQGRWFGKEPVIEVAC